MEEYPDLDAEFLKQISVKEPQYDKIHNRSLTLVGRALGWLFDQFIFSTHLFTDATIERMTEIGQRAYDEYNRRYSVIDRAIVKAISQQDIALLEEAKKESGWYDPNWFCAEVSRMNLFCELYSHSVEQNCMQFNLRAGSGIGLATYFYRPAFKWGLLKSLLER